MNSIRDVKILPGADIDSYHTILLSELKKRFKKVREKTKIEFGKKIRSKQNYAKEIIEKKFCHMDEFYRQCRNSWEKVKGTLLYIINNDIGNVEIATRKP
jgi:hypothetical protein